MFSPLEAYNVYIFRFFGFHFFRFWFGLTLDTIFLYGCVVFFVLALIFCMSTVVGGFYPKTIQRFIESDYLFCLSVLKQQISNRRALVLFPLLFTVFNYILFSNLVGLLPFSFTLTAQLVQTFTLGFSIFLGLVIFGILHLRERYLTLFVPEGVSSVFAFFLVYIEVASYVIRPFSLSVRLFANMLAGHTLLAILSVFVAVVGASFY